MGIVLGALGGAGSAMQDMGLNQQKAWLEQDNQANASALALQREQALEVFKNNLQVTTANQQRDAQTSRINNAASGIVTGQLADKYAGSDAAVQAAQGGASPDAPADPNAVTDTQMALTPEQQSVIDQSKATDKAAMMADPNTRIQAGIQTGDIPLKDVMNNTSKLEINQIKMDSLLQRANDKNATSKEIADVRAEALKYGYELRLQAAQEKAAAGHVDTATGRMMITGEDANIKASTSLINTYTRQLADMQKVGKDGKPNPDYIALQDQITEERDNIKAAKQNKVEISKSLGFGSGGNADSPAPVPRGEPQPQPGVTGAFDLNDPALQASINDIKDPQERANARAALAQQTRAAAVPVVPAAKPASAASGTKDYSKLWK